jgi:predicted dehydrogenase
MPAVLEKSVALVGAGRAAREWLEILPEFPELALAAVVDPDAARLRDVRARGFASVAAMLDSGLVPRVAILCTPPSLHLELIEPLLRAGVDVLVEPPLATTPADADRIAEIAERADRCAVTATRLRTASSVGIARARIAAGAIGRLCAVEISLGVKRDAREGWRGDPALSGGGAWMELGPDALDAVEAFAGPVRRIRVLEAASLQNADVEDEVRVETEHDGGVVGILRVSWNDQATRPIARCIGDRGEITLGRAQTILRGEDGREEILCGAFDDTSALATVLNDFLREYHGRERRVDTGAQTLAWIHAGYRSVSSRRWELG